MNGQDLSRKQARMLLGRPPSKSVAPPSERSATARITISAGMVLNTPHPDAETYARALVPIVQRWCERPLEVARWMVRILEEASP